MSSLRILLTPTERRRPWIIYLTPGLLPAQVLHISIVVLGLAPLRRLLLPALADPSLPVSDTSALNLIIYTIFVVMAAVVLTPLEVITTRLAIQRNHASVEYNSVSQEAGEAENAPEYGGEEDVIGCVLCCPGVRFADLLSSDSGMKGTHILGYWIASSESLMKKGSSRCTAPGGLLSWVGCRVRLHELASSTWT